MKRLLLLAGLALCGCTTGVVPAGPQTYVISRQIGAFSNGAAGKAALYREANEWCTQRGLVMMPVSTDAYDPQVGKRMGSAELTFRALPPGDAEIKRPTLEKPDYIQRVQER